MAPAPGAERPAPPHPLTLGLALGAALLIGLAPLPEMLAAAGLALGAALALASPLLGACLAVLSVPAQDLVRLPGGMTLTQAAVPLAAASWALRAIPWRAHGPSLWRAAPLPRLLLPWLALLLALLLSASLTPFSRSEALRETARWGAAFLVWLVAATSLRRRWHFVALAGCLVAAPAACAAIGLAQFASGDGPPAFRIAQDLPFVRAYGTIGQPNSFAGYMNMAWPIALALSTGATLQLARPRAVRPRPGSAAAQPRWRRFGLWTSAFGLWSITALLLTGLAASFSRGAWLGAAIGLLGLAAALGRRWAIGAAGVLAAGALALALGGAGALPEPLGGRLASISRSVALFDAEGVAVTPENFAVVERMAHIQAGWRMLRERPLVGVGPGNYSAVYPRVAVGQWYASRGHAHNFYLHIAAEAGLIGLAAYLALVASAAAGAVSAARHANDWLTGALAAGCCGMIAAVAGHNLFEQLHVLNMGVQLAAAWAIATALPAGRRSD